MLCDVPSTHHPMHYLTQLQRMQYSHTELTEVYVYLLAHMDAKHKMIKLLVAIKSNASKASQEVTQTFLAT